MSFGGQTLIFVSRDVDKSGEPDALGGFPENDAGVAAPRCRHRPLAFKEVFEMGFEVGTGMWKSTIPIGEYWSNPAETAIYEAVIGAEVNDVIKVDGVTYQIIGGVRPHSDMGGAPFKATIISKVQTS